MSNIMNYQNCPLNVNIINVFIITELIICGIIIHLKYI